MFSAGLLTLQHPGVVAVGECPLGRFLPPYNRRLKQNFKVSRPTTALKRNTRNRISTTRAFDPFNIPAIVNAIELVLGAGHPIWRTVQAAMIDPGLARDAWNTIANLPDNQRREIAGILSGTMMPGL